jgi:succinate dehydrogenase / fumarate reductase cytochrome b subunit
MNWFVNTFSSSIGRKITMSLTGLFLCSFLLVHLSINLLMLLPDGGNTFNKWAEFMGTNPVIRTLEVVLIVGLLLHAYQGLSLAVTNRKAREPVSYVVRHSEQNSRWASRNMTTLGLLLLFLGCIWAISDCVRALGYWGAWWRCRFPTSPIP